jgi:hypothetical protein
MNGDKKGSWGGDIVVIIVFLMFLAGGGYFAWQAVSTLMGPEPAKVEPAKVEPSKTDNFFDFSQLEKSIKDKMDSLFGPDKPKTPKPAAAPGSALEPKSGPAGPVKKVEMKSINIFEAGKEIPAVKSRVYATKFNAQARLIYVEINYKNNNYQIADANVPIVIQYYGPAGQMLTEMKVAAQPKKEWASAFYTRGWNPPPDGSAWPVGTYKIKVILDGEPAGDVSFEIQ